MYGDFWVFLLPDYCIVRQGLLLIGFCFSCFGRAMPFVIVYGFPDVVTQLVGVLQAYLVAIVSPFFLFRHRHAKFMR